MRVPPRRIRNKLDAGGHAFGATVQVPSPDIVEMVGYAGLDYAWIDAEHGSMDIPIIGNLVRAADAAGIDAIVRVPDQTPSFIHRVLDTGAAGIIVPHVRNADVAAAAVASAKYAPEGVRGACPCTRAHGYLTEDWAADAAATNADVLVLGLIEDLEGVENIEAIASESGIDGVLFGPVDLAQEIGLGGDITHPDVTKLRERVIEATRAAGIHYFAITAWEFRDLREVATYSRILNISSDRLLLGAFRSDLADAVDAVANRT